MKTVCLTYSVASSLDLVEHLRSLNNSIASIPGVEVRTDNLAQVSADLMIAVLNEATYELGLSIYIRSRLGKPIAIFYRDGEPVPDIRIGPATPYRSIDEIVEFVEKYFKDHIAAAEVLRLHH